MRLLNPKVSFATFKNLPYNQMIKICRGMKVQSKRVGIIDLAIISEETEEGKWNLRVEWVNKT